MKTIKLLTFCLMAGLASSAFAGICPDHLNIPLQNPPAAGFHIYSHQGSLQQSRFYFNSAYYNTYTFDGPQNNTKQISCVYFDDSFSNSIEITTNATFPLSSLQGSGWQPEHFSTIASCPNTSTAACTWKDN